MLKIDTWLTYWHRKMWNNGVIPDKIAIPERFYGEILIRNLIYPKGHKETFMGRKFKIIQENKLRVKNKYI